MLSDFLRAVAQLADPRFRRVLWLGLGLTLALLFAIYALFLGAIGLFAPDTLTLPLVGEIDHLGRLLSWASLVIMIGLSVFLMVPVAAAFSGLFLDDIARAVEDRHYPGLPPVTKVPLADTLIDAFNFFAILVTANILALVLYAFAGPFIPVVFWALNGYLLGREYFQMAAMRRLGRKGAKALRARHNGQIWAAGILMAAPLSIPLVNLLIPVLGAATFTHLYHRLSRSGTA
ncbi:MAG: EI24 domain-containing protein [Paracoccaceae bacterium]